MSDDHDIIALYRRHALAWTKARGKTLPERPWLDRFRQLLPTGSTLVDLGCGSGVPIARYLVDSGFSVTGVDSAPEMIDLYMQNLPDQSAIVGDMRKLDLGIAFNGILAWDSFFHLSHGDQRRMFAVFGKHAQPLAALMFTSGPSFGEAIGSLEGERLYHASLDAEDYRQLLHEADFELVAHVANDEACGGRTIWLARRR